MLKGCFILTGTHYCAAPWYCNISCFCSGRRIAGGHLSSLIWLRLTPPVLILSLMRPSQHSCKVDRRHRLSAEANISIIDFLRVCKQSQRRRHLCSVIETHLSKAAPPARLSAFKERSTQKSKFPVDCMLASYHHHGPRSLVSFLKMSFSAALSVLSS
jgi:hypothetical protein